MVKCPFCLRKYSTTAPRAPRHHYGPPRGWNNSSPSARDGRRDTPVSEDDLTEHICGFKPAGRNQAHQERRPATTPAVHTTSVFSLVCKDPPLRPQTGKGHTFRRFYLRFNPVFDIHHAAQGVSCFRADGECGQHRQREARDAGPTAPPRPLVKRTGRVGLANQPVRRHTRWCGEPPRRRATDVQLALDTTEGPCPAGRNGIQFGINS